MDFLEVQEAKKREFIPKPWHNIFPDTCIFCGHPMIISDTLTQLKCGNPRCYRRVAGQVVNMLSDLGIKGYGMATVYDYVKLMKFESALQFVMDPPLALSNIKSIIAEQEYTYPQLIRLLNIPRLKGRVDDIFKGIDSYEDYQKAIAEAGSVESFACRRLGGDVLPFQIAETLTTYDIELEIFPKLVPPVKQAHSTILIAITGSIQNVTDGGSRVTKDAYIKILNDIVRPAGISFKRSDALMSVTFIVADSTNNTAKYRKGKERNILVTSDMLYNQCVHIAENAMKSEGELNNGQS